MNVARVISRRLSTVGTIKYQKLYEHHIPLTNLQKVLLSVGSGVTAIIDPHRHDLVADFGETTGHLALKWMHKQMLANDEGRRVLKEKPRLRSDIVDYERLKSLPENTFGYQYSRFYTDNRVSPDTRKQVQFVDDAELAFVMQRYRELHDIVHTILNQPTTIKGEIIVKAFEAVQTGLPLCVLGGLLGPLKMNNRERVDFFSRDLAWAIRCGYETRFLMNIFFEERFEQDMSSLRSELNIKLPND
jgi:ubiquinone biosynthesis protein COQ4